jgi:drug/metabolite transporter (DMT)-like permease
VADPGRPAFPPGIGVAIAVVSVSFAAPLFRLADAPPITASFWRLALATLLILPFTARAWPAWRAYTPRDWGITAASGIALGLHFGLWVWSLEYTSVAASTCLVTLQAVFVALGGHFLLGDRLARSGWAGIALAVAGAVAIALTDHSTAPQPDKALLGDALALAGGLGSAAYMLIGRRLRATRGLVEYVLVALPIVGQGALDGVGTASFGYFVLLAAVPMLGGHTIANWAVRYIPAHTVATWILLEPVGAALIAWAYLSETPALGVLLGGALVLAGAALTIPRRAASPAAPVATEPSG